jgi:hypothetical protein
MHSRGNRVSTCPFVNRSYHTIFDARCGDPILIKGASDKGKLNDCHIRLYKSPHY